MLLFSFFFFISFRFLIILFLFLYTYITLYNIYIINVRARACVNRPVCVCRIFCSSRYLPFPMQTHTLSRGYLLPIYSAMYHARNRLDTNILVTSRSKIFNKALARRSGLKNYISKNDKILILANSAHALLK